MNPKMMGWAAASAINMTEVEHAAKKEGEMADGVALRGKAEFGVKRRDKGCCTEL